MAEFCLDCWNKINHTRLTEEDVILDEELDLCEECGEMKPTIIKFGKRKKKFFSRFRSSPKAPSRGRSCPPRAD